VPYLSKVGLVSGERIGESGAIDESTLISKEFDTSPNIGDAGWRDHRRIRRAGPSQHRYHSQTYENALHYSSLQ